MGKSPLDQEALKKAREVFSRVSYYRIGTKQDPLERAITAYLTHLASRIDDAANTEGMRKVLKPLIMETIGLARQYPHVEADKFIDSDTALFAQAAADACLYRKLIRGD